MHLKSVAGQSYAVIATLGPACSREEDWRRLIDAGASALRINTSHLSLSSLWGWLDRLQAFAVELPYLPVVLDLQGSKWRLGEFLDHALLEGSEISLVLEEKSTQVGVLPVPHPDFFKAANFSSSEVVLNDAKIHLDITSIKEREIKARVKMGGEILPRKGITYLASQYRVETLSVKDQEILRQTAPLSFLRFALSYGKDALEVENFTREVGRARPASPKAYLIAKLERQPAVDECAQIAPLVDELWLCRGDLGAELGLPAMAEAAHRFARQLRDLPVQAILAGQVLEHMTTSLSPTRAEICGLYDALTQGYQGVVLSDETAVGKYPFAACQTAAMFRK